MTLLARRLRQVAAARRLPRAEARRARQAGGRDARKTTSSSALFIANTHDYILCFSNRGQVYWLKVYEVPPGSRTSRGKPIVNLFPLAEGEKITAVLPVKEFDENHFVFMATAQGTVKKTPLVGVLAPAAEAASSPSTWTRATT